MTNDNDNCDCFFETFGIMGDDGQMNGLLFDYLFKNRLLTGTCSKLKINAAQSITKPSLMEARQQPHGSSL
jgi:hypothetical protein